MIAYSYRFSASVSGYFFELMGDKNGSRIAAKNIGKDYFFSVFPIASMPVRIVKMISGHIYVVINYKNGKGPRIVTAIGQVYLDTVFPVFGDLLVCAIELATGYVSGSLKFLQEVIVVSNAIATMN